jgi:hypothetical protein
MSSHEGNKLSVSSFLCGNFELFQWMPIAIWWSKLRSLRVRWCESRDACPIHSLFTLWELVFQIQ